MPGFSTNIVEVLELLGRFILGEQGKYDQLFLPSKRSEYKNYITESSQKKYFSLDKFLGQF